MQTTAQGWLVLQLTGSAALLGLTSAVAQLPVLVLSVWAGVLADRLDRRRLLIATQLGGAALAAALVVLTATGTVEFWHVLVIALAAGCAQAVAWPAFQAVVPTLVERAWVGNAVALNSAQFNLSRIVGPALAGTVIAIGGLAVGFGANAVGFLIVAAVVWTLPLQRRPDLRGLEESLWGNLVAGLRYVRGEREVAALLLLAAVPAILVLNYLVLLPIYARDILAVGAAGLGLLTAAIGVGALAGSIGVAVLRPTGGDGRLMLSGLAVAALAVSVFAVSTSLPVSLVALVVLGAAQVSYYATTNTLLQILTPARLRGRIMSLYMLTAIGVGPIGNVAAGAVAERFGSPVALAGGGLLTLGILVVVALLVPELGRLRVDDTGRIGRSGAPRPGG